MLGAKSSTTRTRTSFTIDHSVDGDHTTRFMPDLPKAADDHAITRRSR